MKSLMKTMIISIVGLVLFLGMPIARADLAQIKAYKEAYPGAKPKCINCHMDEKPKKDDGAHEANAYGKAAIKVVGEQKPTAETYIKIGKIEDFKK